MRETVHICITSHDEVMFRDEEDFVYGFNCFANALLLTGSRGLADGEMTTHVHFEVQTDSLSEFTRRFRYPYGCYFNGKYRRKGRLGDKVVFSTQLRDTSRITACATYINRQGLHHGLASNSFEYPYCSSNAIFRQELGKQVPVQLLPDRLRYKYLPRTAEVPETIRMAVSGQLFREDVIDTHYVEELYITSRNFLYQMNRISDEQWKNEQVNGCRDEPPVTLETMEKNVDGFNLAQMLANEKGRVRKDIIQDIDLCTIIDRHYVPLILDSDDCVSVYSLPMDERIKLGNMLYNEIRRGTLFCPQGKNPRSVTLKQLTRCLGLNR